MEEGLQKKGLGAFFWLNGLCVLLYLGLGILCQLTEARSGEIIYDVGFYVGVFLPVALLLANVVLFIKALWYQQSLLALCCIGVLILLFCGIKYMLKGLGGHA